MWRIHLTAQELARVRLAPAADPICELRHSLRIVNGSAGEEVFGRWRRACRRRFGAGLKRLDDQGSASFDAVFRTYFDRALAPHWLIIHGHVADDLSRRRAALVSGGIDCLFATLSPWLRWDGTALMLNRVDVDRDLCPDGRGLVLQPSFFLYDGLSVLRRSGEPLMLTYPVVPAQDWFSVERRTVEHALAAVLGGTRSRILETLAEEVRSTTDVAQRVGISLPAASQQLARLRAAGLVTSTPHGKQVMHALTALGRDLWATRACGEPATQLSALSRAWSAQPVSGYVAREVRNVNRLRPTLSAGLTG